MSVSGLLTAVKNVYLRYCVFIEMPVVPGAVQLVLKQLLHLIATDAVWFRCLSPSNEAWVAERAVAVGAHHTHLAGGRARRLVDEGAFNERKGGELGETICTISRAPFEN